MQDPIDNDKIEKFLSSLWHAERTLSHRVFAAYFISTYGDQIRDYMEERIAQSGASLDTVTWAKKTRKLLKKYRRGPDGYAYNPIAGTLESRYSQPVRSFRFSARAKPSLTFDSPRTAVRLAGYIMASLSVVVVLYLGYMVMKAIEEVGLSWIEQLTQVLGK